MFLSHLLLRCKNLIFPPRCVFCRRLLPLSAYHNLCTDCMNHLPFCLPLPKCQKCGRPVLEGSNLCFRCGTGHRFSYRKLYGAYGYRGTVKRALLRFKYVRYQSYAAVFSLHLAQVIAADTGAHFDLVVAVPPRKRRIEQEGYDQAAVLAESLAQQLGIPFVKGVLRRIGERQKQSSLSYEDRWGNVRGNYTLRKKHAVFGKRILLVDDICTTGATLDECAKTLKAFGAQSVSCAVAAISGEENIFQF